jgi:CheY-like chemotaxis protein
VTASLTAAVALQETRRPDLTWGRLPLDRDDTRVGRRWVLIADDDEVIATVWAEALATAGYRTIEARSGPAALTVISAVAPDLVILDLHMPEISGEEVLQQLRRSPVLRKIPVLIVSSFVASEPPDGFGLNIVGALSKPIGLNDLLRAVQAGLTST